MQPSRVLDNLRTNIHWHIDDFRRFHILRVTAEMSPAVFHAVHRYPHDNTLRFEFDRVHRAGGTITTGTDWPVVRMPNMFPAIVGVMPTSAVGATIILRWLILGAAEALGRDQSVRSIEPGKRLPLSRWTRT